MATSTTNEKSVFETLVVINCNDHTEKKNNLTYLSWAWAWCELKLNFPEATYKIYETENGLNYFSDGRTCWVKTSVTVKGIENVEYLPIMDYSNKSIPVDKVTSMDVNKAIQRSLTKCCARHGLGLYIYAGEDLPSLSVEQMKEAFELIKPKIETAPSLQYLIDLYNQNKNLKDYQPFADAMTKRKAEINTKQK